ncbi:MAG TPA: type II toxin-antitoxin system VapC family toxin [Stellaceae bacterium]
MDASLVIPTLVEEAASAAARGYLKSRPDRLISDFAAAEVASGLSRLVRTSLLTAAEAGARLADFEAWRAATSSPVDVGPPDTRLAYAYVRRFELMLRAPDALHLAIARRIDATLATLDGRLARAAEELGISIETVA